MNKTEYTLFWLTGETQIVKGTDPADAMNNAGIGKGALRALDFWHPGDVRDLYSWDEINKTWLKSNI